MNVNLDACISQTSNQTICVNEGMQTEHSINNGTLDFSKSDLCSYNLNEFSPIATSNTKTVKININGNDVGVEIKGDKIDSSIFDGIDKSLVTSVVIPEGITTIEDGTFGKYPSNILENLVEVTLPSTLKIIGKNAFLCCKSLKSIEIPEGIKTIAEFTFYGCTSLKSIKIPEGITNIEWGAFDGCRSLEDVTLPSTLKVIGTSAFSDCRSLKRIEIPKEVIAIKECTFFGCLSLEEIILPSKLEYIGRDAFYECKSLKGIKLPKEVVVIEECTFEGCESLEEINIPEGVVSIKYAAFSDCYSLKKVTLPSTIAYVSTSVFNDCINLKECKITSSHKKPGNNIIISMYRASKDRINLFYFNKEDLNKYKKICEELFNNLGVIARYVNVYEQSQGVSSKLDWSWKF